MTRNDAIGGWVPYLDGGQSKVGIHESLDGKSFRIYGWRVSDKNVSKKFIGLKLDTNITVC